MPKIKKGSLTLEMNQAGVDRYLAKNAGWSLVDGTTPTPTPAPTPTPTPAPTPTPTKRQDVQGLFSKYGYNASSADTSYWQNINKTNQWGNLEQNLQRRKQRETPTPTPAPTPTQPTTTPTGQQILNEQDLATKRQELGAAGIPEEQWGDYISAPDAQGRLYYNQPATLTSSSGKKEVVATGSPRANELFKAGYTLGDTYDDNIISSSTMSQDPAINIGDDTTPTTYQADTVAGGFDSTISAVNDEIKRLQEKLVAEMPETGKSETLDELIGSLDPDSLTGRGEAQ